MAEQPIVRHLGELDRRMRRVEAVVARLVAKATPTGSVDEVMVLFGDDFEEADFLRQRIANALATLPVAPGAAR